MERYIHTLHTVDLIANDIRIPGLFDNESTPVEEIEGPVEEMEGGRWMRTK